MARTVSQARYYEKNKETINAKSRAWNKKNSGKLKIRSRKHQQARKKLCIEYLGGTCTACGDSSLPPACYDFHHTNPEEKDKMISQMLNLSWENITKELNKCVLLCANCHRIQHTESD